MRSATTWVSMLTHVVAERILAHHEVLEAQARSINAERERLDGDLRKLPGVTVFPSDANFILVRVPDAARVFEGMRRRGVLVKNLHTGVPLLDHCVRLTIRSEEHTSELQSLRHLVCRLLLEKKKKKPQNLIARLI